MPRWRQATNGLATGGAKSERPRTKGRLIEELCRDAISPGTGHSWCAGSAKGTGCGSRCMFEPDMCTECNWAIISQEHLPVWREISSSRKLSSHARTLAYPARPGRSACWQRRGVADSPEGSVS